MKYNFCFNNGYLFVSRFLLLFAYSFIKAFGDLCNDINA